MKLFYSSFYSKVRKIFIYDKDDEQIWLNHTAISFTMKIINKILKISKFKKKKWKIGICEIF